MHGLTLGKAALLAKLVNTSSESTAHDGKFICAEIAPGASAGSMQAYECHQADGWNDGLNRVIPSKTLDLLSATLAKAEEDARKLRVVGPAKGLETVVPIKNGDVIAAASCLYFDDRGPFETQQTD